jgi:hypothetical protein
MAQSLGGTRRGTCQIWCLTRRLCKKRRSRTRVHERARRELIYAHSKLDEKSHWLSRTEIAQLVPPLDLLPFFLRSYNTPD